MDSSIENLVPFIFFTNHYILLTAQGNGTFTTNEDNTYSTFGGTSASAPATAGVFTQLYQAYKELNDGQEPETD